MRHQQVFSKSSCSCYCPPPLSCSFLSSSFTLSIYFFGYLPLILVPSNCPYSATAGSLLFSILCTCPNHISLFQILSMNVISCPRSFLDSSLQARPCSLRQWCVSHCFGFSPYFRKIFQTTENFWDFTFSLRIFWFSFTRISYDLFNHRLQICNFVIPPLFSVFQ